MNPRYRQSVADMTPLEPKILLLLFYLPKDQLPPSSLIYSHNTVVVSPALVSVFQLAGKKKSLGYNDSLPSKEIVGCFFLSNPFLNFFKLMFFINI